MQPVPQGHGRSFRVAGVVLALLGLLAVVAFASRSGFGHASSSGPTPTYVSWAMSVFIVLFALMTPVAIYAYLLSARERAEQRRMSFHARLLRSFATIAVVLAVFGLGVWLRRHHALPGFHGSLFGSGGSAPHGQRGAAARQAYDPTFEWPVLWGTIALALVLAGWLVWANARREAAAVLPPKQTLEEGLAASIGDAIDDLEAEPDARRAVIAAYSRMERAFARHGLDRRRSETPAEYLQRILLGLTSETEAVRRLTALFEQAKFSTHLIDGGMKQDAIDALCAIRDDLQPVPG